WRVRWDSCANSSVVAPTSSISGMEYCQTHRRKTLLRSPACSLNQSALDMARTAVVLMNLGGPDSPEAIRPFLYNLFSDPAIIRLPGFLRLPLARLIARHRARVARDIDR